MVHRISTTWLWLSCLIGCSTNNPQTLLTPGNEEIWLGDSSLPYVSSLPARCETRVAMNGNQIVSARPLGFAFDSSQLEQDDESTLDCVASAELDSQTPLQLEGHTDSIGSETYNQALGERRARAATFYLQAQGVDSQWLIERSAGESKPVAPNTDPVGRASNRRVEIYSIEAK